jgi:hypothetical protein
MKRPTRAMSVLARPNVMPIAVSKETKFRSETILIERSVDVELSMSSVLSFQV